MIFPSIRIQSLQQPTKNCKMTVCNTCVDFRNAQLSTCMICVVLAGSNFLTETDKYTSLSIDKKFFVTCDRTVLNLILCKVRDNTGIWTDALSAFCSVKSVKKMGLN